MANLKRAQLRQKETYDRFRKPPQKYAPGAKVVRRVQEKIGFPKERWSGPWVIIRPSNPEETAYHIARYVNNNLSATTCNVKHLRPWYEAPTKEGTM